jgi:indolepyruvate ferredoxin oxidoreductase
VQHPDEADLLERVRSASSEVVEFDALEAAERIFGNTVAANFLIVGAAYQAGALQIPAAAIEEAITINGTSVAMNIGAFRWGRAAFGNPEAFRQANATQRPERSRIVPASVGRARLQGEVLRLVSIRAADLVDYQHEHVANAYVDIVATAAAAERAVTDDTKFTEAVARNLYKLTAYKDEYEVARLLTDTEFVSAVRESFPVGTMSYMLKPPVLQALGREKKIALGPRSQVSLRVLARMKFLRGTPADPFGFAHVRKVERELRDHYRLMVEDLAVTMTIENHDRAVQLAGLPDMVRGYESVKMRNVTRYVDALRELGVNPPHGAVGLA